MDGWSRLGKFVIDGQANVIVTMLESTGIPCKTLNEGTGSTFGAGPSIFPTEVWVPEERLVEAEALLQTDVSDEMDEEE